MQTARKLVIPYGVVFLAAATVCALGLPLLESAAARPLLAIAVGGATLFLALRFHAAAPALALVPLAGIWAALTFGASADVIAAAALLVPLNLIVCSLAADAELDGELLGLVGGLFVAQVVAVVMMSRAVPAALHSLVRFPLLTLAWFPADSLPQLVWLSSLLVTAFFFCRFVIRRDALDAALAWCTLAVLCAVFANARGLGGTVLVATSIAMLGIYVVERSYALAYEDELTGLPGRRAFNEAMQRLAVEYTIAVVDVDHFKNFNDTYGHETGDQVLRLVASRLAEVNGGGRAFRCGGEEFAVVFPGVAPADALPRLEELRQAIAETEFTVRGVVRRTKPRPGQDRRRVWANRVARKGGGHEMSVTVSIGVSGPLTDDCRPAEVNARADQALYNAKDAGRNRVELWRPQPRRTAAARTVPLR